jgi:uncharacterized short protein YbdD (DUF466 family)
MSAVGNDSLKHRAARVWSVLRELTGDDAYERYLQHHTSAHPGEPALDRAAFFKAEQKRKWEGVRRCC